MTKGEIIRQNWEKAFEDMKVEEISSAIEWAFSCQDLLVLCCLHEADIYRQEIEDLLEDCNFHTENSLLGERKYDECRELITENLKEEMELMKKVKENKDENK